MNAPLPSEILHSLKDKLEQIDYIKEQKIIFDSDFFAFHKNTFFAASGCFVGSIASCFISIFNTMTSSENLMNPAIEMSLITFSSALLVGSATLGIYYNSKANEEKDKLKRIVLKHQYGIIDKEQVDQYLGFEEKDFHKKFHDAIYNKEIEHIVSQSRLKEYKNKLNTLRKKYFTNFIEHSNQYKS